MMILSLLCRYKTFQKVIQNIFSVDFSVFSKPSLHVVFDSYNMYNALSKRGKRYYYRKIKICVLLSQPSDTQFGHVVPSLAYLKKYIIATKIIHLFPFQQKLYRPTSLSSHGTEVATILVLYILIISKIIF